MTRQKARKIRMSSGGRRGALPREPLRVFREAGARFAGGRRCVEVEDERVDVERLVVERVPERAGDRPPLVLVGTHYTFACEAPRRRY
jgi:hypothetical protein